jgi:hypothetical protein
MCVRCAGRRVHFWSIWPRQTLYASNSIDDTSFRAGTIRCGVGELSVCLPIPACRHGEDADNGAVVHGSHPGRRC